MTVAVDEKARWRVALADETGGECVAVDDDVFHGFAAVRKVPEGSGFRFLVVGARREFWPTGMSSQMGGGIDLWARYLCGLRNILRSLKVVLSRDRGYRYIFAPAPASKVCSAEAQCAYREQWADKFRPK
ncbi:hypothetical protein ACQP1O_36505 [Nocardia sp. CA-151230]|uniref:hypothetical protein n=1 Tax=Nocardia sp. CA-151230 TaxID=3239982 RepID=UPI003D8B58BE